MAASAPLSTASLSTAILDGDGPAVVPDYSPYPISSAGLPMGVDPDLQAGYVVLLSLFDSAL